MSIELIVGVVASVLLVVVVAALVVLLARTGARSNGAGAELAPAHQREALLDQREARLNRIEADQAARADELTRQEASWRERHKELAEAEQAQATRLSEIAALTAEQARALVLAQAEATAQQDALALAAGIEDEARSQAEARARQVIVTSLQRVAAEQTAESAVVVVPLPAEEFKGRLIGKDGRNIRSFEQVTGASLIVDDSPDAVMVSCFDPLRREIARLTLAELLADGRVHPGRIEETYARAEAQTQSLMISAAEAALAEMEITDFAKELLPVLGSLHFRTSYGQNVLAHLVECGHLAATLAAELGLDVAICRRAAFLHDLGKAVTDDSRSHALAGAELARRHNEHPDVVHAIEAHHNEVAPQTVEAVLVQAADAISASRPGARRESLEAYVQRAQKLERLALAHPGVERVFAVQAGREVRVMVAPTAVGDAEAKLLARKIAAQIEAELTYPGQIRVTVVRESRATATAR